MKHAIARLKNLHRELPLLRNGRPAASLVVPPDDNEAAVAAGMMVELVARQTKVELPIYTPEEFRQAAKARRRHVITAGNFVNNEVLVPPYILGRHYVDLRYPGADGYVLRTIHNPEGTGINYLIIGGSTAEGVRRASEALCEMLFALGDRLVLVPTLAVQTNSLDLPEPTAEYIEQRLAQLALLLGEEEFGQALESVVVSAAQNLDLTGDHRWARLFVRACRACNEFALAHASPWTSAHNAAHRWLWKLIVIWDNIEELAAFTDANRLAITRCLYAAAQAVAAAWAERLAEAAPCPSAEELHAAATLYEAARYFGTYYNLPEAKAWRAAALPCLDCAAGLVLNEGSAARYAAAADLAALMSLRVALDARGELPPLENQGFVRRVVLLTDNLNNFAPYGACAAEAPQPGASLRASAWRAGDGRALWPVRDDHRFRPGSFYSAVEPQRPEHWLRLAFVPVPEAILRRHGAGARAPLPPPQRSFDKLAFRSGYGDWDEYLLLSGAAYGPGAHRDVQAIVRLSVEGQVFIADAGRAGREVGDHSALLVVRDGQSAPPPPFAWLEATLSDRYLRAAVSVLPEYNGVNWRRVVLHLPALGFVVADCAEAVLSAGFNLIARFRLLGAPAVYTRRLVVEREGVQVSLRGVSDCQWSVRSDPNTFDGAPALEPSSPERKETVVDQHLEVSLVAGERVMVASLINFLGPRLPVAMAAEHLSDLTLSILPLERRAMIFSLDMDQLREMGIDTDARAFVLWDRLILLGAQRYAHEDITVTSDEPFCLILDPSAEDAVFEALNDTTLTFRSFSARAQFNVKAGKRARANLPVPVAEIEALHDRLIARRGMRAVRRHVAPRPACEAQPERRTELPAPARACALDAEQQRVAVACEGRALLFSAELAQAASLPLDHRPTGLCLLPQGIALACADGAVRLWQPPAESSVTLLAGIRPPQARAFVHACDINGDGEPELVIAAGTHVRATDARGTVLWSRHAHGGGILALACTDHFGRPVIACSTEDGAVLILNSEGEVLWREEELGPAHRLFWLPRARGALLLVGGEGGRLAALRMGPRLRARQRWQADLGDRVTAIAGSGNLVAACARSCWAGLFTAAGEELWRRSLGAPLTATALVGQRAVFGSAAGDVFWVSPEGVAEARGTLSGAVHAVGQTANALLAVAENELARFALPC